METRLKKNFILPVLLILCLCASCGHVQNVLPFHTNENGKLELGVDTTPEAPEREFSELFNPYYSRLGEDERDIYAQFVEAAEAMQTEFVPCHAIAYDSLSPIYAAVCYDQTQLFWLGENYRCLYSSVTGEVTEIQMQYTLSEEEIPLYQERLTAAAQAYLDAASGLSAAEQEKTIHDMLCRNIRYDTDRPATQSVYNALVDGSTACSGYSKAFRYLMTELGLPCYFCYGQGYGGSSDTGFTWDYHAWNLIQLGDDWYNVDVTWDATAMSQIGLISYSCYNRTDEDFSQRHIRDEACVFLPSGNSDEYSCENLYGWDPELMFAEQLGIQEFSDIYSLQDYYDICLYTLQISGGGESETDMLIHGEDCLNEISAAIDNREHMDAYVSDAMAYLGWNGCSFQIQTNIYTVREDEYLFIQHNTLTPSE